MAEVKDRAGQELSNARLESLLDIRMTYKIACAWKAFAGKNSAEYKWNFDCTTVIVSPEGCNKLRCVVRNKDRTGKVEATHIDSSLNLLVKIPTLGSASGEIGRLVTIVAIGTMPEGVFFKSAVSGLTHSSSGADRVGYMYFCKSKGGCPALWKDLFMTFIIINLGELKGKILYSHEVIVHATSSSWNPYNMRQSSEIVGLH